MHMNAFGGTLTGATQIEFFIHENILYLSDIIECLFDNLCGDATFCKEDYTGSETEIGGWGLLDGLVLARVYHFLRADIKSLAYAALTCKHWRSVSKFYKDICRQADLSSVGPNCSDSMICNILDGYNKEDITSLVLRGCTNITSQMLGSTWLRDEVRNLPRTYKCRYDAAADLIHIYAFIKFFFRIREYKAVTSPPVFISPLDLGPKYSDKLGSGFHEYRKTWQLK